MRAKFVRLFNFQYNLIYKQWDQLPSVYFSLETAVCSPRWARVYLSMTVEEGKKNWISIFFLHFICIHCTCVPRKCESHQVHSCFKWLLSIGLSTCVFVCMFASLFTGRLARLIESAPSNRYKSIYQLHSLSLSHTHAEWVGEVCAAFYDTSSIKRARLDGVTVTEAYEVISILITGEKRALEIDCKLIHYKRVAVEKWVSVKVMSLQSQLKSPGERWAVFPQLLCTLTCTSIHLHHMLKMKKKMQASSKWKQTRSVVKWHDIESDCMWPL